MGPGKEPENRWNQPPDDGHKWKYDHRGNAIDEADEENITSPRHDSPHHDKADRVEPHPPAHPPKLPKKEIKYETKEVVYESKEERVAAFKEMMLHVGVSVNMHWKDAVTHMTKDNRYLALTTAGERKETFNHFQTQRKKEAMEKKRQDKRLAKQAFCDMVLATPGINQHTLFKEGSKLWAKDARFLAIEDSYERQDLFDDSLKELESRNKDLFRQGLESSTARRRIISALEKRERPEKLFSEFDDPDTFDAIVGMSQRREVFSSFCRDAENEWRKLKEQRFEKCSQELEKLNEVLDQQAVDGKIDIDSDWTQVQQLLQGNPLFLELQQECLDKELEETWTKYRDDKLAPQFNDDKSLVKAAIRGGWQYNVSESSEFQDWKESLGKFESDKEPELNGSLQELVGMRAKNLELFFEQIMSDLAYKQAKEQKKLNNRVEAFKDLLEEEYYKSKHANTLWMEARGELADRTAFKDMLSEDERVDVFEEHMKSLCERKENKKSKKEKKKQRKRSRSYDEHDDHQSSKRNKSGSDVEPRPKEADPQAIVRLLNGSWYAEVVCGEKSALHLIGDF
eukprot:TRINITY_DN14873_c0_g1_i1.p1 TRINITY_DN14873_c0_g1~~TRINITY_DN14873_c0_g1_i1.p1  ORF type:complete len:569 (+),score=154.62 TRINITY_DN14873_c0_g1_i1:221-1927(+)